MQNIDILCIGKVNADYFSRACAEYQKRCTVLAGVRVLELPEERLDEKAGEVLIRRALDREGEAMLKAARRGSHFVALCVEGRQLSSEELAAYFSDCAISGCGDITFFIGSSCGLSEEVKRRAELRLSMSKMTFPHQLARVVLLEQIYRALTIQKGLHYHK